MGLCIDCKYHEKALIEIAFNTMRIDICEHPTFVKYSGVDGTRLNVKWCQDLNINQECQLFTEILPEKSSLGKLKNLLFRNKKRSVK